MRRFMFLTVVALMVVVLASTAQISSAAVAGTTIKVNTKADESNTDGDCSLREAIKAANTNKAVDGCAAGSSTKQDAIHFALGNQATITLGSTLPDITDPSELNIDGQKAKITVRGNHNLRMFFVNRGAKFSLLHLTVANGHSGLNNNGGQVEVSNSTFSGNSSFLGGGGINNRKGTLTVTNSTFSGNSAGLPDGGGIRSGGGIRNTSGTLEVSNSTFSGNSAADGGSGIYNHSGGKATLKNTIVANSTKGENCAGGAALTDGGYNIEDGTSCSFRAAKNSLPSTNPKLASSLANNGSPTKTLMLLSGSPAINTIPQATNGCGTNITTDQRGVKRPQGNRCDIGAFEKRQ